MKLSGFDTDKLENNLDELSYENDDEQNDDFCNIKIQKDNKEICKVEISEGDCVVMCLAYLPIILTKVNNNWEIKIKSNPIFQSLLSLDKTSKLNVKWVGYLSCLEDIPKEEIEVVNNLLLEKNIYCINISYDKLHCFELFISDILAPLFFYTKIFTNRQFIKEFDDLWEGYKAFNEAIASKVVEILSQEKTLIWVHEYHLMLTPNFIRNDFHHELTKNVNIGLFIHRPFPSTDQFNRFPLRLELLKSMMNCSTIGFNSFSSSRNFIKIISRTLGIPYESNTSGDTLFNYFGRSVVISINQIFNEKSIIEVIY